MRAQEVVVVDRKTLRVAGDDAVFEQVVEIVIGHGDAVAFVDHHRLSSIGDCGAVDGIASTRDIEAVAIAGKTTLAVLGFNLLASSTSSHYLHV